MGWFFRRNNITKREFSSLIESIKSSFSNVKNDISNIKTKTNSTEQEIQEIHNVIGYLNQSLQELTNKISAGQSRREEKDLRGHEGTESPISSQEEDFRQRFPKGLSGFTKGGSLVAERLWDNLTNVQRSLVINLNSVLQEEGKEWISMKHISQELYPEKDYSDIKAMISNYTDVLDELGFIEKKT